MAAPTVYPNAHVGFDSITSQIERKLLKRGFQFNVICVGTCAHAISNLIWPTDSFLLLYVPQQAACTELI